MENSEAIAYIKAQKGSPEAFRFRPRGFVDWKFGEVAEYLGFEGAKSYVQAALRWHDRKRFEGCLLFETYQSFLTAAEAA